jgi:hypothetical protein
MIVLCIDRESYMEQEKRYFWGQIEKCLQSPKTEFGAQNQYVIYRIDREFYMEQKKIYSWGVKKAKISLQSPKRNLGHKKSKINFRTQKIKISRHYKKGKLKNFSSDSKVKNKLTILECWLAFKRKKQDVSKSFL